VSVASSTPSAGRTRLVVFQHERETGLGTLAPLLDAAAVDYEVVASTTGALPAAGTFDGALVLGGSLSAYDPRFRDLRRWIASNAVGGLPVLGICLGAQLLASALGGRVTRAAAPEVGLHDVFLTEPARHDPLFADLPGRFQVFSWHEDSFALPPGAIPLAGSRACTYQAFRFRDAAYGFQFHPEVRDDDLARWRGVWGYRRLAASAGADWDSVGEALERSTPALDSLACHLLERWLGLVGPARRSERPSKTAEIRRSDLRLDHSDSGRHCDCTRLGRVAGRIVSRRTSTAVPTTTPRKEVISCR
jgi:GMP synthase (glutamine-hydrolysing)